MADPRSRLQIVEETPDPLPSADKTVSVSAEALMLALKALSQRALTALAAMFTLLTVASAWFLWWSIPNPSNTQLISLGFYAAFIIAINVIVRKLK